MRPRDADARHPPDGGTGLAGPRRAARGLRATVAGRDRLHQVVRTHLERFLAETATDGVGMPRLIERESRDLFGCPCSAGASRACGATRAGSSASCRSC